LDIPFEYFGNSFEFFREGFPVPDLGIRPIAMPLIAALKKGFSWVE
jgi:hypothetical protein